jgi:hypothetical protein
VARELGVDETNLSIDSTLFGDLGVDGADGWEFVERFGREFDVDLADFRADMHFGPEASMMPSNWLQSLMVWMLSWRSGPERRAGLVPITMAD